LAKVHELKDVEVTIRRGGEKAPLAVLKPKGTVTAVEPRVIMSGRARGAVLEWRSPANCDIAIAMEGLHNYFDDSHAGETLTVLHVQAGKSVELIAPVRIRDRTAWTPVVVKKVQVKKGGKIQFYVSGSESLIRLFAYSARHPHDECIWHSSRVLAGW
jgi:hypothetical protein